ncbi:uncharacterized protein LOC108744580 [Agrilus planipennis]|uniref:Uncharacterized protein LOC108744580 n=1 Tax=Agrilus planipennis TaxID=224129 RepID=A0A1W4XIY0_AGRPL|nr:uncharacterized protein LOC108744580 [Agrilus planipennis]
MCLLTVFLNNFSTFFNNSLIVISKMISIYNMKLIIKQKRLVNLIQMTKYSDKKAPGIPQNPLENVITAHLQSENGVVYEKKPFKIKLEAGNNYFWCLCGRSKSQPLCDGTHKDIFLKVKQRPIRFQVTESKEYWLCNCKQTNHRPFCDATHKSKVVQDATPIIRS